MAPAEPKTIRNFTCLGCGCLCDDLEISLSQRTIVGAEHACPLGRNWLEAEAKSLESREGTAVALIDGQPASLDAAIDAIVNLLRQSQATLILPQAISTEAASAVVGMADRARASIEPVSHKPARLKAVQRVGEITATLGEIRDRADLVVLWKLDLDCDYPRFRERFLPATNPRLTPHKRRIIEIQSDRPRLESSELFIQSNSPSSTELFSILRALIRGVQIDPVRAETATGLSLETLLNLSQLLASAHYGAFLYGADLGSTDAYAIIELHRLIRDLNRERRFVTLAPGAPDNAGGIESALTWTAGAPASVDFRLGYPRYLPGQLFDQLQAGSVELVVQISGAPQLRDVAEHNLLNDLPLIEIGPGQTDPALARKARIKINTRRLGIDDSGTVSRCDGVMLPARALFETKAPSMVEVIQSINARWDEGARS